MPTPDFVVKQTHSSSEVQEFKTPNDEGELFSSTEETMESNQATEVSKPTGMKKLKKSFKRIFQRKPKEKKDMIQSINIVQEDETDYDKQWSRKVHKAASFGNKQLLSNEDAPPSSSRASSSTSGGTSATIEDDGIPVIFDAEDDIQL